MISVLEYVQIIGVDNALNKVLDPVQIGFTYNSNLQASLKAVPKRDAHEKVGVIGKKNGKYNIVEYSELPESMALETEADGKTLKYNHGHILVFVIQCEFLMSLVLGDDADQSSLYHRAFKKISHADLDTYA